MPRPNAESMPILSVVIVNYRAWPDIERLAGSLLGSPEVRAGLCELIVVDNDSRQEVPPRLAAGAPGYSLVLRGDNGGFAAGVNAGWRASRGRWALLLNPDVVPGEGFLGAVLARIAAHEERPEGPPAIIGFRLLNPDGTAQPSVGREPSLARSLRGVFIPRSRRKYQSGSRLAAGPVPWVTGACALVASDLLAALGGMDEDFFLYYEEVALCRSARGLGRRVEYDPAVAVTHLRPLQNRPVTPGLRLITRTSQMLYFSKHLPRRQFRALTGIVAAEARLRGAWARRRGRRDEAAAWGAIGRIAQQARRGRWPTAGEVRDLAQAVGRAGDRPVPAPHRPRAGRARAAGRSG